MEIVGSRQQRIWRHPAVLNFTLGSMGAGYYLLRLIESWIHGGSSRAAETTDGVLAVALILVGFFALTFEAGNPLKSYLTILNVRHSWMSRELLFAIVFIGAVALNWLVPHAVPRALAGVMALLFIVSQAFIIFKSRAILSWNVWPVPLLFCLSGLVSGYGLLLGLRPNEAVGGPVVYLGCLLLGSCLGVFGYYLYAFRRQQNDFRAATRYLRTARSLALSVGLGLIAPMALMVSVVVLATAGTSRVLCVLAGVCVILGTWRRNLDIITRAGYFRSIQINL
jgi:DMSO reductase anchor subunit